jgi:hypothetical protein
LPLYRISGLDEDSEIENDKFLTAIGCIPEDGGSCSAMERGPYIGGQPHNPWSKTRCGVGADRVFSLLPGVQELNQKKKTILFKTGMGIRKLFIADNTEYVIRHELIDVKRDTKITRGKQCCMLRLFVQGILVKYNMI